MRDKEAIASSGAVKDDLIIEVLLDIRELLRPEGIIIQAEVPAPLYVSDKPPKPRKKRKGKVV